MIATQPGASNILHLRHPARYRCQLWQYHSRLSRLYLRVFQDQQDAPAFFLLFTDVGYLDCPVTWEGADFRIAPAQDCLAQLLEAGLIGEAVLQFPDAYASITDHARLYIVDRPRHSIRIIANSASRLQQPPPEYA